MKFVGPVNSAQVHCSQKTGSTVASEEKKKRKGKRVKLKTQRWIISIQTHS